jgi:signal peptidase
MGTPPETLEFLGSNFLPTLARSIVATFLALLGGPIASIAYLGSLDAVQWLSPILPNPGWTIEALIGTLIPTIGLVATIQTTNPFALMRSGIISKSEVKRNIRRTKRSFPLTWTAVILVGVILVWGSTGLLGFKPSVIASGSMRPALDVGDIVVVQKVDSIMIQPGDIIQYLKENVAITHRVVNIYRDRGGTFFITKGDANSVSDDPVSERAVLGKTLFTIPKLGWVSIFFRTAAANIFDFFSRNLGIACATITATIVVSVLAIRSYRNQPLRRFRRRISR